MCECKILSDIQYNDSQYNDTLPLCWMSLCWVSQLIYCHAECRYAECHYAECRGAFSVLDCSKCQSSAVTITQGTPPYGWFVEETLRKYFEPVFFKKKNWGIFSFWAASSPPNGWGASMKPGDSSRGQLTKGVTWGMYYKTFYGRNLQIFVIS